MEKSISHIRDDLMLYEILDIGSTGWTNDFVLLKLARRIVQSDSDVPAWKCAGRALAEGISRGIVKIDLADNSGDASIVSTDVDTISRIFANPRDNINYWPAKYVVENGVVYWPDEFSFTNTSVGNLLLEEYFILLEELLSRRSTKGPIVLRQIASDVISKWFDVLGHDHVRPDDSEDIVWTGAGSLLYSTTFHLAARGSIVVGGRTSGEFPSRETSSQSIEELKRLYAQLGVVQIESMLDDVMVQVIQ